MLLTEYDEKLHLKSVFEEGAASRQAEIDQKDMVIYQLSAEKDSLIAIKDNEIKRLKELLETNNINTNS